MYDFRRAALNTIALEAATAGILGLSVVFGCAAPPVAAAGLVVSAAAAGAASGLRSQTRAPA